MDLCVQVDWAKQRICIQEPPSSEDVRIRFRVTVEGVTMEGENMATKMTDIQHADATVTFKTAAGNPAQVDGVPVWAVSDEEALAVTASADGMSARVDSVGGLGNFQVTATGDADMGEGVKPFTAILELEVIASEAASAGFDVVVSDNEATTEPPVEPGQGLPGPGDLPHPDHTLPGDLPGGKRRR